MTSLILRTKKPWGLAPAWFDDRFAWEPLALRDPFASSFAPRFEVKETPNEYVFTADLPGVEEHDLDLSITAEQLTVHGKREAEQKSEGETYFAVERSYGSFTRSFRLPSGVDTERCEASLRNGVLMITIPKQETHRPRKVSLKTLGTKLKGMLSGESKPAV